MRQLFAEGCVQSAFWHRFAATAHSPIGTAARALRHSRCAPSRRSRSRATTSRFDDPDRDCDHDLLGAGLRKALYNYMHGLGLDDDVRSWFARRRVIPATTVAKDLIRGALGR